MRTRLAPRVIPEISYTFVIVNVGPFVCSATNSFVSIFRYSGLGCLDVYQYLLLCFVHFCNKVY